MMQKQSSVLNLIQKNNIQSQDIKQIVLLLNQPPFHQNISMVSLDQLSTFDLGDLVFKIFKHLDSDININAKQTQPAEIIFQVTQFLKILSYQCQFSQDWSNGLLKGDHKIIYPIYYFLLKNLSALKKRSYLAKFLVPIEIPQEHIGDPELNKLNDQCKQLQAQFQLVHQELQNIQSSSLNSNELKKQIKKLEQQKQQLTTKISSMKTKHGAKSQIGPMLIATNLLRKQQQQQVKIVDKIQSYRNQLQTNQNQLISLQQSLADGRKSLSPNNSSQQMLNAIRYQVKKNREIVKQRMTVQYNQRLKKLQETQKMLSDPPITQNQLMMLQGTMSGLRRAVTSMQQRLSKQTSKDDKLAIYKGQAALVTKKKQQTHENMKRQEQDMSRLENEIRKKEEQINKLKGAGFKKNKLEDYLNQLKEKKGKFGKHKNEIEQLKWERDNLEKTYIIVKQQKERYEKNYGLVDGQRIIADTNIGNASIQEINREIDKLLEQIRKKKGILAPKLEQKKQILNEFQQIENEYKQKKIGFTGPIQKIQGDIKQMQQSVNKLRNEVYILDTKIQLNKLKNQTLDVKTLRLNQESDNIKGNGKEFQNAKSYHSWVEKKLEQGEIQIKELTVERQRVSDQYNPSMQQKRMFDDLKKLLLCKLKFGSLSGNRSDSNHGQRLGNNVNVLQL